MSVRDRLRRFVGPCSMVALVHALLGSALLFGSAPAATPPPGGRVVVTPTELWSLGGTDDEDELFGVVRRAAVRADGVTYLLDEQLNEVRAYDLRGALVASFGREGGGPGEFTRPRDLFLLPDGRVGVVHGFPARISTFGPDGSIDGDLAVADANAPSMIAQIQSRGGHLVALRSRLQRGDTMATLTRSLVALAPDGTVMRTYVEQVDEMPVGGGRGPRGGGRGGMMMGGDFLVAWSLGADGRVALVRHPDRYAIEVYAADGTLASTVQRPYERVRRTPDELAAAQRRAEEVARRGGRAPEVDPYRDDIAQVVWRDDGTLWVLSSEGLAYDDPRTLGVFDVFDATGRWARQVEVKVPFDARADQFEILGDDLFVFEEAIGALQGMMAGRGGNDAAPVADDDTEPQPLRIVRYRLGALP